METDLWYARWDLNPATPGHVLLLPKRHAQYLSELTDAEAGSLLPFAQSVVAYIARTDLRSLYYALLETANDKSKLFITKALAALNERRGTPDGYNYGVNDGPAAGQSVPHFHFHIMPRWTGDMNAPRGGIRHMFPGDEYGSLT